MAFEDRCSPNQANSPGPITGRVPAPHGENMNIDYNQSQYSCTTIDQRYQNQMTVVKVQPVSPPPSPQNHDYQNYYQEKQDIELKQENYDEKRNKQPVNAPINFSISNILHPDFGLKKTNKTEGSKPAGTNHSILYKPYDLSKPDINKYHRTYYDYLSKNDEPAGPLPPLGGLRQTVSQIGERDREIKGTDLGSKRPDSASSIVSSTSSGTSSQDTNQSQSSSTTLWPAWVYCTRYSDRPSSGPRSRRMKKKPNSEEKRPRTAFSATQLTRLKHEFAENRYLTERRRQALATELGLAEAQIKIWFQNKRAKLKKASGQRNPLALQLMAQGLYNHSTVQDSDEDEEINVA